MIVRTAYDADRVHDALRRSADILTRAAASAWYVTLQNGKRVDAVAVLDGPWLSLSASLPPLEPGAAWSLLAANTSLPGGARSSLERRTFAHALRIDSWLGPDGDTDGRVDAACSALLESASIVASHDTLKTPECDWSANASSARCTEPIRALADELPYPHTMLDDCSCRFDLDARRERYHAVLTGSANGCRCCVELLARPALSERAREAIGIALLTASSALRLARPTAATNGPTDRIGFEVLLPPAPSAEDLDLALGALTSACDQLGREARALTDPTLATAYLGVAMPHRHTHPGE